MTRLWIRIGTGTLLLIAAPILAAEKCRDWNWQKGSRKTAQITLNSGLCLASQPGELVVKEVRASGEAGGYLLDTRLSVLKTEASTKTNRAQNLELAAGAFVFGQKVWSPVLNVATPAYQKSFNLPALDQEFPYNIQLGPIGVKVATGDRGKAGVDISASAELAQLQSRLIPRLDSSGYAYADINLWLAHVGASGSLLFARGQLKLEASTQVEIRPSSAVLTGTLKGTHDLQTLDGRLNVYADTSWAARRGVHSWERQLFGFDGYTVQGTMFDAAIPELVIY